LKNINTEEYWDKRFDTGDWENNGGRHQTRQFAISQVPFFDIPKNYLGTILDFGCGLGDALPIYKKTFPNAKLVGIDISEKAINKCKETYGQLGEFICGNHNDVPQVDVIIASNVFEHLDDDKMLAKSLLTKCQLLYIIVPYNEQIPLSPEHIRVYDEKYFNEFKIEKYYVFKSKGWSEIGIRILFYEIYFKNIFRKVFGKKMRYQRKQIIFKLVSNEKNTIF
jgi:SAM-dependent methyltransferase